ncbi:MAG: hypothetical protein ACREKE_07270 [bacterium]
MVAVSQVNRSGVNALRLNDNTLRLNFDVPYPQSITVRLVSSEHPWIHEQSVGVWAPGKEAVELRLNDWPKDSTYLLARFYEESGRPAATSSQWLGCPGI